MKNFLHFFVAVVIITPVFAQSPDTTLIELPDQRTYFSKTYYNSRDNTYKAVISPGYVHYLAGDGRFKDIDTDLRLHESGAYYIIDTGLYNVAFTSDFSTGNWDVAYEVPRPVKQKYLDPSKSRESGTTRIRWKVSSYGYWDVQKNRYQILEYARSVTPIVSSDQQQATRNQISYPDIFSGIDIRYICGNVSVKEEFVLSQFGRDNLPDPARYGLSRANTYFVVAMEFLLTPASINVFARRPNGKTPIKHDNNFGFYGDDPIEFEDADSTLHFFFPKDYAYAAADSVTDFSNRVSMRRYFYSDRGRDYMLVGVPWSWINQFPIGDLIIDPTTSITTSTDVRIMDGGFYGTGGSLSIGKNAGTNKSRSIISFNVSTIPASATVLNAQMQLYYYSAVGSTWGDRWVQAHQVYVSWAETQANRDNRRTGVPWKVQYGKIGGGSDSIATDANGQYESTLLFQNSQINTWKTWDLSALTQKWVSNTTPNLGVLLWATNEDTDYNTLWFRSSEYSNSTYWPKLEVTYSTDAATQTVYFLKDHLGSVRATVLDSAGAPVIGYDDYDPWGYPLALRTKAIPNAYLQGGSKIKFTGKEYDDEYGLNLGYYGSRYYDGLIGRWISVDPLANKYPSWSPYVYTLDNSILFIDPNGEETYVNSTGYVIKDRKILDAKDPSVYVVNGDALSKIGEVGGNIVVTTIFTNLLNQNMATAAGIYDPSTFKEYVTTGGKWDLKNLKGENGGDLSIFAQGEIDGKTTYTFGKENGLRSDDLGNIHYGATGLATGLFSEATLLREAGLNQISSDYFNPKRGPQSIIGRDATRPPYGDDLRDQKYISVGFGIQGHKPPGGPYNLTVRALTTAVSENRAASMYKTYPGLRKP